MTHLNKTQTIAFFISAAKFVPILGFFFAIYIQYKYDGSYLDDNLGTKLSSAIQGMSLAALLSYLLAVL